MGKLLVRRRGFRVRLTSYLRKGKKIRRRGFRVKSSSFSIFDRGSPGRGPRLIPILKKGTLGVDFSKPTKVRRRVIANLCRRIGERKVMGKLRAVQVLTKRTNPVISAKARSDARWVAGSFIGRKMVGYGSGFRRKGYY